MAQDQVARFPATRRALAKQHTRRRLIAAAKQLIGERGYEAATLREVAALAEVSTGAVFANFQDKADLFNEAIVDDLAELPLRMKAAAVGKTAAGDALSAMVAAGYAAHFERLSLVQAQMGFSWWSGASLEQRRSLPLRRILEALAEVVRRGVETGELSASVDVDLIAEMVWDNYVAGYRHAIFDGWTLEALCCHARARINVLLGGCRLGALGPKPWPSRRDERRPTALHG